MNKCIIASLVALTIWWTSSAQAQQEQCSAGLAPDVSISNSSAIVKYAFLELIDQTHYEEAKTKIKSSGDAELLGLISLGGVDLSYNDFSARRDTYLSQRMERLDTATATSIAKYSVPAAARTEYFECVKRQTGLKVYMLSEARDTVNVEIHYRGDPGSKVRFTIDVINATASRPAAITGPKELDNGGAYGFALRRRGNNVIRVTVNAANLTAHSISVVPPSTSTTTTDPTVVRPSASFDLCYFRADPSGTPYVQTFGGIQTINLDRLNIRTQYGKGVMFGDYTLRDADAVIYRIDYSCAGSGCGWSYNPDGGYSAKIISLAPHQFRWLRLWQTDKATEAYTAYYERPRRVCVANCTQGMETCANGRRMNP